MPNPTQASAPKARINESLLKIEALWQVGHESLSEHPDRMPYGHVDGAAAAAGLHPETYRKARVFAQLYTRANVERLCRRCRKARYVIGESMVIRLLALKDQGVISPIEAEMIEGHWSKKQLDTEIKKRFGKNEVRRGRVTAPADEQELYVQLIDLCDRWDLWLGQVRTESVDERPLVDTLPETVRRQLMQIGSRMEQLREEADRRRSDIQQGE